MESRQKRAIRGTRLIALATAVAAVFLVVGIAIAAYNLVVNGDFSNGTSNWSLVNNNATMAIGVNEPTPVRCPADELEMELLTSPGIVQQCIPLSSVVCSGGSSTWTLQSMLRSGGPTLESPERSQLLPIPLDLSEPTQLDRDELDCCPCPCGPPPPAVDHYITAYVDFYSDSTCGASGGTIIDSLASSWWASGFMSSPTGIPVSFTDHGVRCDVQSAAVRVRLQGVVGSIGCADNIMLCNGVYPCVTPPLAVTLGSFAAEPRGDHVRLTWETVAEMDVAGFNLYRSETPDNQGALLVYLPAQTPGSSQGNSYAHEDGSVQPSRTYTYRLEEIALDGTTSLQGPISVTAQTPTAVGLSDMKAAGSAQPLNFLWPLAAIGVALAGAVLTGRRLP